MLRFTLAQMRLSLPRLVAGGLAVAIGSAFVAATLLAGTVMTTTARNSVSAEYARADLVVADVVGDRQLAALSKVAGVAGVGGRLTVGRDVAGPDGASYLTVGSLSPDPRLEPQKLISGTWPAAGQIAVPSKDAGRLGVADGGQVVMRLTSGATEEGEEPRTKRLTLTVSGLLADPTGAFSTSGGMALVPLATAREIHTFSGGGPVTYSPTLLLVKPGADVETVRSAAFAALTRLGPEAGPDGGGTPIPEVRTKADQADEAVAELTGDTRMLYAFVLAFAAIALVVAALVIANTFQVLVAQRTRTLALLRCVGAVRQQIRRSVLIEAGIVGLAASATGVLAGALLTQLTLLVLRRTEVTAQLPATIQLSIWVVLVPVVVGTTVTLIASLSPARAATRVAPLAALRPDDGPRLRERAGRARFAFSVGCTVLGVLALALGLVAGQGDPVAGLGIGLLGGALSFLGIVVGTVFWVPRAASGLGRLLALGAAAPARLAAVNSVRNPRRTAATSGALLIGVTLVALMTTGASTARSSLANDLDASYPVDISVGDDSSYVRSAPVSQAQLAAIAKVAGVRDVVPVPDAVVSLVSADGRSRQQLALNGLTTAGADAVLNSDETRQALADGKVVLSRLLGNGDPTGTVRLRAGESGPWTDVQAVFTLRGSRQTGIAPAALLDRLAPTAVATQAWVSLDPDADAAQVYDDLSSALAVTDQGTGSGSSAGGSLPIEGTAVQRESYDKAINAILAVVVGLLGISVVIALVGVANTLSLSVLERRRESATLRTIGLTRRQLRWMLAVEGMVIAAIGSVAGVLIGTAYGWIGTRTVLGGVAQVSLDVPWIQLGLTIVVAVLAGLLASVLPARGAARTSPVAALATT